MDEQTIDITKLKYVLYARKSSKDDERQVRSIPDQIKDCREIAKRHNLHIVGQPLSESQSAKEPNQRPIFRQMLEDIKAGKYDAILTWDPDRLARNMLEGGEVITLVDKGVIKDLKFVTHYFTNNSSGKILLGISFAISKQYSDYLSEKVSRGVKYSFEEGKSPAYKHGYIRSDEGTYQPDYQTFDLIKSAWKMRAEDKSLELITDYLNESGYKRVIKSSGREIVMRKQILWKIFQDPFYYGKLVQANQSVYLPDLYDFKPMLTEEEFYTIQLQNDGKRKFNPLNKKEGTPYLPLRLMVKCSLCDENCDTAASKGNTKKFLYYRCKTKGCPRKGKSTRAKVVFNFITDLLKDGLNFTEKEYHEYQSSLTTLADDKKTKIRTSLSNTQGSLNHISHKKKTLSLSLANIPKHNAAHQITLDEISELKQKELTLLKQLTKYQNQLEETVNDDLTIEEFLNLSKNAYAIVKSADAMIKDEIVRMIFLNFSVDGEKVTAYQLKEPFCTLLKTRSVNYGRVKLLFWN